MNGRGNPASMCHLLIMTITLMVMSVLLVPQVEADPGARPDPSPDSIFGVRSVEVTDHLALTPMTNFSFMTGAGPERRFENVMLVFDTGLAFGLYDFFEFDLFLPFFFLDRAESGTAGRLLLQPRFEWLDPDDYPIGVGTSFLLFLPVGGRDFFPGSQNPRFQPIITLEWKRPRWRVITNTGINIEDKRSADPNQDVVDRLVYGVGVEYDIEPGRLTVLGEWSGEREFDDFFSYQERALLNLAAGVKYQLNPSLRLDLGATLSLIDDWPSLSLYTGLDYRFDFNGDSDGDGMLDHRDQCAGQAEDFNGIEDDDGCPDDNDGDGIPNLVDGCVEQPEDPDNFRDDDGCPDLDNDADGVLDLDDQCPLAPGLPQYQGCSNPDPDGDGILNAEDACPNNPEDTDQFEDEDGCPEPDNDQDGILDLADGCPLEPEDVDGHLDNDGCPDPDNDADGVLDRDDACPSTRGHAAWRGCPDRVVRVFFAVNEATILAASFPELDAIADELRRSPEILKVEVQGHTDDVGTARSNERLSKKRADAVRRYLVSKGVAKQRLVARGYGEDRPALDTKGLEGDALEEARGKNRRVVLVVLEPPL